MIRRKRVHQQLLKASLKRTDLTPKEDLIIKSFSKLQFNPNFENEVSINYHIACDIVCPFTEILRRKYTDFQLWDILTQIGLRAGTIKPLLYKFKITRMDYKQNLTLGEWNKLCSYFSYKTFKKWKK